VHELIEARDEKRLLRLQRQLASYKLLIIDELGYVPLSQTGAELLFEVFSQRYERGSTIVTSNLPFDEWTTVFASERLTGALLDRLTAKGNRSRFIDEAIRERICTAETVVFLGFGYYPQNLQLIAPDQPTKIKWMLGTGHGLSDSDRYVVVQERLGPMFRSKNLLIDVTGMKCVDLLTNHRMALSA
jgi:hypothetical protein